MPSIKALGLMVSDKNYFLKFSSLKFIFSLYDLDMHQTGTIIKEGHIRIITAKFGKKIRSLGGDVL